MKLMLTTQQTLLSIVIATALSACGGSESGSSSSGTPSAVKTLTISPTTYTTQVASSYKQGFTANLKNSNDAINWTLTGAGTLSSNKGKSTVYTPPNTGTASTATLTASAGSLSDSSTITIHNAAVPPANPAKVVAYAWASSKSDSRYEPVPTYAYNASGGNITATRSAKGKYRINFAGLTINKGNIQVTAYNSNANCMVQKWSTSTADIACYDAAGSAQDSMYTISVIDETATPSTANVVAYAWANNERNSSYNPSISYAYNKSGGAITAKRVNTGQYSIEFDGLTLTGGNVQVTAYGSKAKCTVGSWNYRTSKVRVNCHDSSGNPVDSKYNIAILDKNAAGSTVSISAYVWANQKTLPSYIPTTNYSYHQLGSLVMAKRNAKGTYKLQFRELTLGGKGNIQVSSYGSNRANCTSGAWNSDALNVKCYNSNGNLTDSRYTVVYFSKV